jgi:SPP1 gp7 family putative phage head morphogenesis protein
LPALAKPEPDTKLDAPPPPDGSVPDAIDAARAVVKKMLGGVEADVEAASKKAAKRADIHAKRELSRLGIKLSDADSGVAKMVPLWRKENVARITGMVEDQLGKVERILEDGAGHYASTLAKEIQRQCEDVSDSRAELIARSQVLRLNGQITRQRQVDVGITEYIFTTSNDERVREEHAAVDGQRFSWDDGPDFGHPGEDFQCLPGESLITLTNGVKRAYRRRYHGELTTLVTDSGVTFECTPNHPILTATGWKPAQSVDIDDHVFEVGNEGGYGPKVDGKHAVATIADTFNVISCLSRLHERTAGRCAQFHGDGSADHDVHVVNVDLELLFNDEPSFAQRACEFLLAEPPLPTTAGRRLELGFFALVGATNSVVSGLCDRLADFVRRVPETLEIGLAAVAQRHTSTNEEIGNRLALHAVAGCEGKHRSAVDVATEALLLREALCIVGLSIMTERTHAASAECLGEIVGMASERGRDLSEEHPAFKKPLRVVEKLGRVETLHVFNLETFSGWYSSQIAVRNCRCVAYPIIPALEDDE